MNNWAGLSDGKVRASSQFVRERPYQDNRITDPIKIRAESEEFLDKLVGMFGNIPECRLSGAFGLSVFLDDFSKNNTNSDFAVMAKLATLEKMVEAARENELYLFSRKPSLKPSKNAQSKLSIYYAVEPADIIKVFKENRNYQFCQVDQHGNILPEHRIDTRVRLHLHREVTRSDVEARLSDSYIGRLLCIEDGLIFDTSLFNSVVPVSTRAGSLSVMNPAYMLAKLSDLVSHRKYNKPKHQANILRIRRYLAGKSLRK